MNPSKNDPLGVALEGSEYVYIRISDDHGLTLTKELKYHCHGWTWPTALREPDLVVLGLNRQNKRAINKICQSKAIGFRFTFNTRRCLCGVTE